MKGAVATGHHLTSEAALDMLNAGGNAVDAAIAAYAVACVSEPAMASLAAGGFAMIYMDGQPRCLDFFCQTPAQKRENARLDPIPVDFGTAQEQYYSGIGSVAIPGTVKGLFEMHRRYGKIPMREILQPAITYAREGVTLTPFQALDLKILHSVFTKEKRGEEVFMENGALKQAGQEIRMPFLADFMEVLAREKDDLFYHGEIAQQIHDLSRALKGHISYDDLTKYEVRWIKPTSVTLGDFNILMPPAPSMGHALFRSYLEAPAEDKSILLRFWNRSKSFRKLLTNQKNLFESAGMSFSGQQKFTGTSHLNVLDKNGGAVSMTFSIGEGSGIFLHGSDIHLNNMLGEPSLLPNGLNSWNTGQRLASMMTPTLVFQKDRLQYLMGSGGAERIASMLGQVICYLAEEGLTLEEAIQAPRTYLSHSHFEIEPGFEHVPQKDEFRYWEERSMYFGGVHAIQTNPSVQAIGDLRREGHGKIIY